MKFISQLLGGATIIIVAGSVGIAQNTVRSKPLKLLLKATRPATAPAELSQSTNGTGTVPDSDLPADEFSQAELASRVIPRERVKTMMEVGVVIVIDARGEAEYAEGHIPGALNIPFENFVNYTDQLNEQVPTDSPVIVYCRSVTCDLSDQLAQELALMDYEHVVTYKGGWQDWSEAAYPTETE